MADARQTARNSPTAAIPGQGDVDGKPSEPVFNVPNTLTAIRLLGSVGLIGLAWAERPMAFLGLYVILVFTDWCDGKLAILLHQRTELGARLDSAADATLHTALLVGFCWLKWEFFLGHAWWILAAAISFAITSLAGLLKFRRMPSYHTRAAKASNILVFIAVVCLFCDWAVWPFYVAMSAVMFTNLEATAITIAIPQWRADVRSIFEVIVTPSRRS